MQRHEDPGRSRRDATQERQRQRTLSQRLGLVILALMFAIGALVTYRVVLGG
jgi:hypothetical protein